MTSSEQGMTGNGCHQERKVSIAEPSGEWELLSPETAVNEDTVVVHTHPLTLEGKTVVLRRNEKANSDIFLNRVAALLAEKIEGLKIIKAWEAVPGSDALYPKPEILKQIADLKPDLVISAQGD